ncbi:hypothetical protein BKA64DRAFT_754010 [Cadophora sp. MPI-SDFR-AT-0126]|nr:hypothetical protein BKA64DRAFT_754010 [Leotiomycetes sp. MPI-SDFR-AT-0126]
MFPHSRFLQFASLFLFSLLSLSQYANGDTESFEVGDLAQYSTAGVPTPTLTGSEIEVTAIGNPADNGFLMFLSPNLKSSLASAMDRSCVSGFNTGCYGAVIDVLEGHDVLLQARSLEQRDVERRGLDMIVSAALPLVIPPTQVWEGLRIEEATEIIVVNTASPTTITVPPEQGTPTGSPAVLTTFAAVTGNARRGDVGIKLEPTDALHVQQLLSRADYTCQVDYEMDDLASMMVRGLSMTDVVCAAQNLLVDGIDREGYADYLNIDQAQLPFTDAALVAARNKVIAWALLNARLLNGEIQAHTLHALAVGAFALSWLFLSQAGTLSSLNIIAAASLQGGGTATECEQQTATQCTAACGVYTWAPQYDCKTAGTTDTSCDATSVRTTTATTFKPTYLPGPKPTTTPSSDQGQQFAIASYINPLGDPAT